MRNEAAGFVLGIMLVATAMAKTPPPAIDKSISESDASWRAASKPSDGLTMGKLKIEFEETTLSDVVSAIKSGSIQHQGDAAESVYWLCYTDGGDAQIWLEASGEMGGPENRITGVTVERIANPHRAQDCPVLPRQFKRLSFNNGVRLGASKSTVEKVFTSGLLFNGEQAFIGYHGRVASDGRCDGGYDLLNSLFITFRAGLAVSIDAGQVTSC